MSSEKGETISEKISGRFQKRWNRMNEIKTEIQNFVREKEYERASYYSFNLTDWLSDHGNIPAEEWETWWFAERNPPNDNGLYNFATQCISAETHPEFDALGKLQCF